MASHHPNPWPLPFSGRKGLYFQPKRPNVEPQLGKVPATAGVPMGERSGEGRKHRCAGEAAETETRTGETAVKPPTASGCARHSRYPLPRRDHKNSAAPGCQARVPAPGGEVQAAQGLLHVGPSSDLG